MKGDIVRPARQQGLCDDFQGHLRATIGSYTFEPSMDLQTMRVLNYDEGLSGELESSCVVLRRLGCVQDVSQIHFTEMLDPESKQERNKARDIIDDRKQRYAVAAERKEIQQDLAEAAVEINEMSRDICVHLYSMYIYGHVHRAATPTACIRIPIAREISTSYYIKLQCLVSHFRSSNYVQDAAATLDYYTEQGQSVGAKAVKSMPTNSFDHESMR